MKKSKMRSETGNLDKYRFMNCDHNSNTEYVNEKDNDGDRIHCILKERQYICTYLLYDQNRIIIYNIKIIEYFNKKLFFLYKM